MISSPSRLAEHHRTLVLDASVILNLLGSGRAQDILRFLNRTAVVEEVASTEILIDPFTGRSGKHALEELRMSGCLTLGRLANEAYGSFLELVGAPSPNDVGDGEAATIAHAQEIRGIAVLDDRKATRIALGGTSPMVVLSTLDLLSHMSLIDGLGRKEIAAVVFNALRCARMRVDQLFLSWVIELIGPERVRDCPSVRNRLDSSTIT